MANENAIKAMRRQAVQQLAAVLVIAGIVATLHRLGVVFCPTRLIFGVGCPFCGTTRALFALAAGDVRGALALQPMMTIVVPVVLVGWGINLVRMYLGFAPLSLVPHTGRVAKIFWALFIAALLANWGYLIAECTVKSRF